MLILYSSKFKSDLDKLGKLKGCLAGKIWRFVFDIEKKPTALSGLGKPEGLKYNLRGHYSRRINQEHRLIYSYDSQHAILRLVSAYGHYQDLGNLID